MRLSNLLDPLKNSFMARQAYLYSTVQTQTTSSMQHKGRNHIVKAFQKGQLTKAFTVCVTELTSGSVTVWYLVIIVYGKRSIMSVSMTDRLKQSRREMYCSPGVGLAIRVWVDALTQLHQY